MPYIKPEDRDRFDEVLKLIPRMQSKGELEYCIFKLMLRYIQSRVGNYTNLHDSVYAAQHCADEFRRRFLDRREDEALSLNGDVY